MTSKITINESWSSPRGGAYGVTVKSQPLTFDLDERKLGAPVAAAMADVIRQAIEDIPQRASAATMRARKRLGITSDKLYSATGKLVGNIVAKLTGDASYAVTVPGDRLERDPALMKRLSDLVPLLREPARLLEHPTVRAAIEKARDAMITIGKRTR